MKLTNRKPTQNEMDIMNEAASVARNKLEEVKASLKVIEGFIRDAENFNTINDFEMDIVAHERSKCR